MKKIFLLLIMFLLVGCGKNENELVMVTEAGFAPYEYYENGEIVGIDVDISKEIANYLGKELVVKDVAFDSIINEVKSGKADFAAAGISYSEERAQQVAFSIDYVTSKQVVLVRKDSSIKNIKEISNKKIAVQLGTVADNYVTDNFKDATIIREKKYLATIEDLKDNKVEVVVMDELPAKEMIKSNTDLKILDGQLTIDSYGMIVNKNNQELLDAINTVLERLINEGKIEEFSLNHQSEE